MLFVKTIKSFVRMSCIRECTVVYNNARCGKIETYKLDVCFSLFVHNLPGFSRSRQVDGGIITRHPQKILE